jgi:hypothetical protein
MAAPGEAGWRGRCAGVRTAAAAPRDAAAEAAASMTGSREGVGSEAKCASHLQSPSDKNSLIRRSLDVRRADFRENRENFFGASETHARKTRQRRVSRRHIYAGSRRASCVKLRAKRRGGGRSGAAGGGGSTEGAAAVVAMVPSSGHPPEVDAVAVSDDVGGWCSRHS